MTRSDFPPEKVGPKLRRHALLRAWEEIEAEAKRDMVEFAERAFAGVAQRDDGIRD